MERETLRTLCLGTALVIFGPELFSTEYTVEADLRVCPGLILHATAGADTQVCPYTYLQSALIPTFTSAIEAIQSDKPAQPFKIEDLSWISGDWETAPGRAQIDEHWTKVAGGSLIGMSRTVAGGKTVFFEYLRIEARGAEIYYVAHPKARTPGTDFKLARLTSQEAVFENPAHDFPKRIIYRKNSDGSLTARIEGDGTEKEKPQDFHYRPIPKDK